MKWKKAKEEEEEKKGNNNNNNNDNNNVRSTAFIREWTTSVFEATHTHIQTYAHKCISCDAQVNVEYAVLGKQSTVLYTVFRHNKYTNG